MELVAIMSTTPLVERLTFFKLRNIRLVVTLTWNMKEKILLVLMRYWLVRPGWSTSWIEEAKMAAMISSGVNTD